MSFHSFVRRLCPPPRQASEVLELWQVPARLRLSSPISLEGSPALLELASRLAACGVTLAFEGDEGLHLQLDSTQPPQAYRLRLDGHGVLLTARDEAGFAHGLRTLSQWIALHSEHGQRRSLLGIAIEDHPSFAERGVMIDVARDKRPTMETLFQLVERLASLKINRLQLYMEADFAYSFGAAATEGRSAYEAHELRALDVHCLAHGIELVPNQQSFGHMHRWLRWPEWQHLAEVPAGLAHPFSREVEPFSLCPSDPASLDFLERMFDELLPCFSSDTFNVGLDETFDLGQGRSAEACTRLGKHQVYLDFLHKVHALVARHGKRMQFWGDIVLERPELCRELPADAIAMNWGYEASHPFDEELAALAAAGRDFQVCPGTSSWNSFVGRTPNAAANLRSAASCGVQHGARGMLITDWGDRGHLQPAPISAPGLALGAALAWNAEPTDEYELQRLASWLDDWWFDDSTRSLGQATIELGRLQEVTGESCKNGTAAFFFTILSDESLAHERFEGLTLDGLEAGREHLSRVLAPLSSSQSSSPGFQALTHELELARDLASFGIDLGIARFEAQGCALADLPAWARSTFAERLLVLSQRHRELWPKRYRPAGLEASVRWLEGSLLALDALHR